MNMIFSNDSLKLFCAQQLGLSQCDITILAAEENWTMVIVIRDFKNKLNGDIPALDEIYDKVGEFGPYIIRFVLLTQKGGVRYDCL